MDSNFHLLINTEATWAEAAMNITELNTASQAAREEGGERKPTLAAARGAGESGNCQGQVGRCRDKRPRAMDQHREGGAWGSKVPESAAAGRGIPGTASGSRWHVCPLLHPSWLCVLKEDIQHPLP